MITNRRINVVSERKVNYDKKTNLKYKMKVRFIEWLADNIREIFSVIILFLIGIIVSIIFVNNFNQIQQEEIKTYISDYCLNIKEGKTINQKAVLLDSIKNNLIFTVILWFGGLTIIGIPIVYITVIFKGFTCGYAISTIIAVLGIGKGSLFAFGSMFLQNLIALPAIFGIAISGIKIYKVIVKNKTKENIKLEICRHTITTLICFNILIIESFMSAYIITILTENIIKLI